MGVLQSCSCVNTTVLQHCLDTNETFGEKVKLKYTRMLHAVLNKFW